MSWGKKKNAEAASSTSKTASLRQTTATSHAYVFKRRSHANVIFGMA